MKKCRDHKNHPSEQDLTRVIHKTSHHAYTADQPEVLRMMGLAEVQG